MGNSTCFATVLLRRSYMLTRRFSRLVKISTGANGVATMSSTRSSVSIRYTTSFSTRSITSMTGSSASATNISRLRVGNIHVLGGKGRRTQEMCGQRQQPEQQCRLTGTHVRSQAHRQLRPRYG